MQFVTLLVLRSIWWKKGRASNIYLYLPEISYSNFLFNLHLRINEHTSTKKRKMNESGPPPRHACFNSPPTFICFQVVVWSESLKHFAEPSTGTLARLIFGHGEHDTRTSHKHHYQCRTTYQDKTTRNFRTYMLIGAIHFKKTLVHAIRKKIKK